MAELTTPQTRPRPLSPHLQIYRLNITMAMSIVHRITGAGLYFGILLVAWWLLAAGSPNAYGVFETFIGSWIGRLVLFGYTWTLLHHALGGLRHLIWDMGRGFERTEREMLALATLVGSIGLTILLWAVGYLAMGGPR